MLPQKGELEITMTSASEFVPKEKECNRCDLAAVWIPTKRQERSRQISTSLACKICVKVAATDGKYFKMKRSPQNQSLG